MTPLYWLHCARALGRALLEGTAAEGKLGQAILDFTAAEGDARKAEYEAYSLVFLTATGGPRALRRC